MMSRQSLLPRWVHRLRAHFGGYFWLPCPICGRRFGGHEWKGVILWVSASMGWAACQACRDEADRRNHKNGFLRGSVRIGTSP